MQAPTNPPQRRRAAPWWARPLLGTVCIAVGVALTLRPFTSLGALVVLVAATFFASGISEIVSARAASRRWLVTAGGVAWLAGGVLVLAWAGITIHALAIVVGISMLVGGLTRIAGAVRGRGEEWWIAGMTGLASAVLGILALSWADITVLVLALLVGPATVIFGFGQMLTVRRPWLSSPHRLRRPRWLRAAGAAAAVVFALGLVAVSAALHHAAPTPGAFYTAPATVPDRPGALVRSERYTKGVPSDLRVWRILYTTTRNAGVPALSSGIVVASDHLPPGPRPVIAWAHGTTGVASNCAPSLLPSRWDRNVIPGLDRLIGRGWVLVASDYVGLGTPGPHPYLIGQGEARSVLDSVRAARQITQLSLTRETVVWGHSQGGHAALWAGMIAPSYAPDVNVVGVAALAPASDLRGLVGHVKTTLEGQVLSAYVLAAYSAVYPDVSFDHYVRPGARVLVREAAKRCLDLPEALPSALTGLLSREAIYAVAPLSGALGRRLAENTPTGPIEAPVLIAQGGVDPLVLPSVQRSYVNQRCAAGQAVEYVTYRGRDHLSVLQRDSRLVPFLLAWTQARFAGRTPQRACSVAAR
jgi:uncharacterized membrane protein HdeD (DUF308 family)